VRALLVATPIFFLNNTQIPASTGEARLESTIFSKNRYPPRITCGAGFFGIMLYVEHGPTMTSMG
jgi:hypothetical protein